ncbi:MAG: hypothetical protein PHT04_05675, partial [Eubacteriales bacterium]|nr:hypothetical protein [Eubacteriales bacterium]
MRTLITIDHQKHSSIQWLPLLVAVAFFFCFVCGPSDVIAQSTRQEINEAKNRQEQLAAEKAELSAISNQLEQEADTLTGELAWLNDRTDEQRDLYREKTEQLVAAVSEMEAAYTSYLESEETLELKEEQYAERVQVMFENRNRSIFEIILESKSLQ